MRHPLQIGATVGKGEFRVQAAEALVAAVRSSAASSPELVEMILQASPAQLLDIFWPQWRALSSVMFGTHCSGSARHGNSWDLHGQETLRAHLGVRTDMQRGTSTLARRLLVCECGRRRQIACQPNADQNAGAVQLLKYLLANGSMEYKSAKEEKGILAGDERELEEPLLANLLHGKVNDILALLQLLAIEFLIFLKHRSVMLLEPLASRGLRYTAAESIQVYLALLLLYVSEGSR